MAVRDNLGIRMKEFYEQVPKYKLYRRTPVAIRIDGKAFHTFTRGFQKPFDSVLGNAMVSTMEYLCKEIQGCVFGYCQSDEITLILLDYQTFDTDAWFDYEIQKICSISASMATMAFTKFFQQEVVNFANNHSNAGDPDFDSPVYKWMRHWDSEESLKTYDAYCTSAGRGAMFDARCFNIPKEEVCNLIYWRQLDATRNSIQMVGQANFSHSSLQGLSCAQIQEKLFQEKNINWDKCPTRWKRGVCCYKEAVENDSGETISSRWVVDYDMPILKGEGRRLVDSRIFIGEGM